MINLSWKIFSAFGIPVRLHFSMVIIPFIAFSWVPGNSPASMIAAIILSILLFGSVLLHELGHALTGRRFGVHTADIVLTPIGGMARMQNIPTDPKQEIAISIAGPLVSFAIAGISYLVLAVSTILPIVPAICYWAAITLFQLNLALGLFNLVPALPMDGGRVFRGILALKYDHLKATRIAAKIGKGLAVAGGAYAIFNGSWSLALIAIFVYTAAGQEERYAAYREAQKKGGVGFGFPFGGVGGGYTRTGRPHPGSRPSDSASGKSDPWKTPEDDWSTPRSRHQGHGPSVKVVQGGKVEVISRKTPDKS